MSEQVPCEDKRKFSGTSYIRQTFRENKTYVDSRFCKPESKWCVARTNFFRCIGQKALYFSSSHISKHYDSFPSSKCPCLLEEIFLSAFILLYSQAVTRQEHSSMVTRMCSDYWQVSIQYERCYEIWRSSVTDEGHYVVGISWIWRKEQ